LAPSGSRVISSFHDSEPGSLTMPAPWCARACQTLNGAAAGSATMAIRPESKTSNGSENTFPPAAGTLAAVASASSTATYVFHSAGPGLGCPAIAATSRPRRRAMK